MTLLRREFLRRSAAALAAACVGSVGSLAGETSGTALARAAVPSSGRRLARVGLGTWQTFDVAPDDAAARAELAAVLREFVAAGADVIDTSPMYGRAEDVLGELLAAAGLREKVFVATKVWTTGRTEGEAQMAESLRRLRATRVELMQVHNLVDWRTQLASLRRWRDEGRVDQIGLTHYTNAGLPELARLVRTERIDFVQFALSLEEPEAAGDFLKLCADRGVAFLANRPFGGGDAFRRVRGRPLPAWAEELGIGSWAQFLLKWVLSHPEVTCAIPGTSKAAHLRDNLGAARGPTLDPGQRDRMRAFWASV